jgi:hypothetical protein
VTVPSITSKRVRIGRVGWYTKLRDLHRSDPIARHIVLNEPGGLDEGWLSKELQNESSLVYTPRRDIHAVGIVALQMLMGLDVTNKFVDVRTAVSFCKSTMTNLDLGCYIHKYFSKYNLWLTLSYRGHDRPGEKKPYDLPKHS